MCEKMKRNGKETKKKSLYAVGDVDDNGNIVGVDAGGTCDNEPVFNRVSEKKGHSTL